MGTINYGTNKYITLGYNCNNIDYDNYDFESEIISEYYNTASSLRKEYIFYYFNVSVISGYYEGFYIDIEHNISCYDDTREKREALQEVTTLKTYLIDLVKNAECVACFPGWSTGYLDYESTLKEINRAIKKMREVIKITPTEYILRMQRKRAQT